MSAGLVIFAATYALIAVQRLPFVHLNRPAASLLGAVAMVVFGVLSLEQAYAAIDFDVLVFLLGLMLIVGYLEVGKFFRVGRRVGHPAGRHARAAAARCGRGRRLALGVLRE
jgi:Na+/H+ antiporter NhaD/arsenite permease-like protein